MERRMSPQYQAVSKNSRLTIIYKGGRIEAITDRLATRLEIVREVLQHGIYGRYSDGQVTYITPGAILAIEFPEEV